MCTIQSVGAYKQLGRRSYETKESPEKYLSKKIKCYQLAGLRAVPFFFDDTLNEHTQRGDDNNNDAWEACHSVLRVEAFATR